jgi:hypothetical protein
MWNERSMWWHWNGSGGRFIWYSKSEYLEKASNLSKSDTTFLSQRYRVNGDRTENWVVIGTDCRCRCKCNYHAIVNMKASCLAVLFNCYECRTYLLQQTQNAMYSTSNSPERKSKKPWICAIMFVYFVLFISIVNVLHNCDLVFVTIVLMIHTADVLYNCGHIFVSVVLMIHTITYSCRIVLVYIVLMNHDIYVFFMIVESCLP